MHVVVGRIGRAHGVQGEVAVEPRTEDVDVRFAVGEQLRADPGDQLLTVDSVRRHHGRLLVRFKQMQDRESVAVVRGSLLLADVPDDEAPTEPDTWYDRQLIGLAVEVSDQVVGSVAAVVHLPGQDLLEVELDGGRRVLVPLVEQIVPEVDVAAGRVFLDPPAGLLESAQ